MRPRGLVVWCIGFVVSPRQVRKNLRCRLWSGLRRAQTVVHFNFGKFKEINAKSKYHNYATDVALRLFGTRKLLARNSRSVFLTAAGMPSAAPTEKHREPAHKRNG